MKETGIFVREQNIENDSNDNLKEMIRVVPSVFWITLVGGVLIIVATLIWSFTGYITTTETTQGVYHPGASDKGEVLCFMPLAKGKTVQAGMDATVYLMGYDQQEYGFMEAEITYVDPYITSIEDMRSLLGDDSLVNIYAQQGPVVLVVCKLQEDAAFANGYYWSNARGGNIAINDGMFATASMMTKRIRPITVVYPNFGE